MSSPVPRSKQIAASHSFTLDSFAPIPVLFFSYWVVFFVALYVYGGELEGQLENLTEGLALRLVISCGSMAIIMAASLLPCVIYTVLARSYYPRTYKITIHENEIGIFAKDVKGYFQFEEFDSISFKTNDEETLAIVAVLNGEEWGYIARQTACGEKAFSRLLTLGSFVENVRRSKEIHAT